MSVLVEQPPSLMSSPYIKIGRRQKSSNYHCSHDGQFSRQFQLPELMCKSQNFSPKSHTHRLKTWPIELNASYVCMQDVFIPKFWSSKCFSVILSHTHSTSAVLSKSVWEADRVSQSQMFTRSLSRLIVLLLLGELCTLFRCKIISHPTSKQRTEEKRITKKNSFPALFPFTLTLISEQISLSLSIIKRIFCPRVQPTLASPEKFDELTILLFIKFDSLLLKSKQITKHHWNQQDARRK